MIYHNVTDFLLSCVPRNDSIADNNQSIMVSAFFQRIKTHDISSRILQAKSLERNFVAVLQTIEKLREILRNFNDDVETVFDNFVGGPSNENCTTVATMASPLSSRMSLDSQSDAESLPPAPATYSFPSLPPSISHSIESVYSFTSDVCNYRCGVFGTCEITHIIDSVECICCMVDFERYVCSLYVLRTIYGIQFSFAWCPMQYTHVSVKFPFSFFLCAIFPLFSFSMRFPEMCRRNCSSTGFRNRSQWMVYQHPTKYLASKSICKLFVQHLSSNLVGYVVYIHGTHTSTSNRARHTLSAHQ